MHQPIRSRRSLFFAVALAVLAALVLLASHHAPRAAAAPAPADPAGEVPRRVKVLFLGDKGHHEPLVRLRQVYNLLGRHGIDVTYLDRPEDALNPANLNRYDVLFLYANIAKITPDQEKALFDFVESGHGFVPVHCASFCFTNSPRVIALMGGKFQKHSTGTFKETIVQPDHPIEQGLKPIESWDETYVHTDHNDEGRTILGYRVEGDHKEPYTWTRTQGKGRVFYTAWGHDERTWSNADFQNLIERGIRWAAGDWALQPQPALKPFAFGPGRLPNYVASEKWGTMGQDITKVQLPLDPAESMKHMAFPPGFEPRLFASEPEIKKPICMAFDERGRLWVAETFDYPNEMQDEGKGRDRITVCEDTDGDGKADKFTLFADKLSIPTSMVFANGGVIVSQAPHMLFLKDTSGVGYATERRVLFTGWGTKDTHAGPSNLHWGMDGWVYGTVGYSGFDGEVGGKPVKFGAGAFRFKPDGSKMEFLGSTNNNTWGFTFSEDFEIFTSTANHNPAFYLGIPNRYFESVLGWSAHRPATVADNWFVHPIAEHVRQMDQHGGYTAGAGAELYTARTWPSYYWNRINFVTEPTVHVIGQFVWEPLGSGFLAVNNFSLMGSDDDWTAPIAASVGPDGQVWFIDWYNIVVQHNPIPKGFEKGKGNAYETDMRDKRHGRVYRVVYKDGKPSQTYNLADADPQKLVEVLKSDNMFWRMQAQRLLVERGKTDVVPALIALVNDPSVDAINLNTAAIHALWTLYDLGALDGKTPDATAAAVNALKHASAGVRKNALAVLPRTTESTSAIVDGKLVEDPQILVRKGSLLALADMPPATAGAEGDRIGRLIYQSLATIPGAVAKKARTPEAIKNDSLPGANPPPQDTGLTDAAIIAAARHDAAFLKAVFAANPLNTAAPTPDANAKPAPVVNLFPNPSFENEEGGNLLGWASHNYGGTKDVAYEWASVGHTGNHSLLVRSETGADAGWAATVKVDKNTDYRLSGWVKTDKVSGAMGALLNVHNLQGIKTNAVTGTSDWKKVETTFNSGAAASVTVNCLFGGWGKSRGTAWFDDVELVKTHPPITAALPGAVGTAVQIVSKHYAQRGPTESILGTLSALKTADAALASAIVDGLAAGWPKDKAPELDSKAVEELQTVMAALPASGRDRLLVLGTRWGRADLFGGQLAGISKGITDTLNDATQPTEKRVEAARRWIGVADDDKTVRAIVDMINPAAGPDFQVGLIDALGASHTDGVGEALVKQWKKLTPASQKAAAGIMLRKPAWTTSLVKGLDKHVIDQRDISSATWQSLTTYPDDFISKKARTVQAAVGRAPTSGRKEIVDQMLPLAEKPGDVALGQQVFEKNCMVCHTLEGKGGKVGPELTGIGAKPKADNLIDIMDPNRSVEGTFREWTAKTADGEILSGRLLTETATTVELIDTTGNVHTLQRKDIKSLSGSDRSVMPEGFEVLKPEEISSLLDYLATSKVKH